MEALTISLILLILAQNFRMEHRLTKIEMKLENCNPYAKQGITETIVGGIK